jgi:hypothetical protein
MFVKVPDLVQHVRVFSLHLHQILTLLLYSRFSCQDTDMFVKVPDLVQHVSGFFVDVLSPSQIFALKMAAVICVGNGRGLGQRGATVTTGNRFRADILRHVHNIKEYQSRLQVS